MKKAFKKITALVLCGVLLTGGMTVHAAMSPYHCVRCSAYYFETGNSFGKCPDKSCEKECFWYVCNNCGRTDVICTVGHISDY